MDGAWGGMGEHGLSMSCMDSGNIAIIVLGSVSHRNVLMTITNVNTVNLTISGVSRKHFEGFPHCPNSVFTPTSGPTCIEFPHCVFAYCSVSPAILGRDR